MNEHPRYAELKNKATVELAQEIFDKPEDLPTIAFFLHRSIKEHSLTIKYELGPKWLTVPLAIIVLLTFAVNSISALKAFYPSPTPSIPATNKDSERPIVIRLEYDRWRPPILP